MPIEFDCENCSRTLRVPEGSSGKMSQCPACGQTQEIPFVVAPESDDAKDEAKDEAKGDAKAEPTEKQKEKKLKIPCPKCSHLLVCSAKLEGSRGQCRKCNAIFTITTVPEKAVAESTELVFNCPECDQLFEGREEMRGRKGKCHSCNAVFVIELKRPAPIKSTVVASSNTKKTTATSTIKSTAIPTKPTQPSKPIRFECKKCSGIMEVPGASAGLETECPYCQAVQSIPARSTTTALSGQARPSPVSGTQHTSTSADIFSTIPYSTSPKQSGNIGGFEAIHSAEEPLALNPYAALPKSSGASQWLAPADRLLSGLSFSNAFQTTFERMFPTCLLTVGHMMVVMGCYMIGGLFIAILMWILSSNKISRETAVTVLYICLGVWGLFMLPIAGWFYGSISHMALRAIRKKPFDFGKCFTAGGAFEAAMLFLMGGLLLNVLSSAPNFYEAYKPGSLGILAALWPLLLLPVIIIYNTLFSLSAFAAVDGDETGSAFATSSRLVTSNIGVMIGVKILVWMMTILLIIPTLGLAMVLPIYFNATLYDLARKGE